MYPEYASEIYPEELDYIPQERPTDIQFPPIVNKILLVIWCIIFLVGLGIIYRFKNPVVGGLIIGIPTFIGMVIKPTFALCMVMLVLPTGAGIGFKEQLSLDRGVGLALALSFLLNIMISRPTFKIRNKALWVLILYTIWITFASMSGSYFASDARRAFTQFQLMALVFIVYWILNTNGEKAFRWGLRAYVIGSLGTVVLASVSGAAMQTITEADSNARYVATLGEAIDANMLAVLVGLAFLAGIYLFARDKNLIWKLVHLAAVIVMPIMLLRIASRGALIAMAFTLLSPLLFVRQVMRKPALAILMLLVIIIASGSAAFFVRKRTLAAGVEERLTNIAYAKESIGLRMRLNKTAIESVMRRPMGTGYTAWFQVTGALHHPHNDFFFLLGVYGIPCAAIFTLFIIMLMFTIKRAPLGLEKIYARAVLTFLLVAGLSLIQVYKKHYWVFITFVIASEPLSNLITRQNQLKQQIEEEEIEAADYDLALADLQQ